MSYKFFRAEVWVIIIYFPVFTLEQLQTQKPTIPDQASLNYARIHFIQMKLPDAEAPDPCWTFSVLSMEKL